MSLDSISSASAASVVTPSDTVFIPQGICRSLYVGGTGHVIAFIGGEAITFLNVQAGTVLPIKASRVQATGTTATGIVALY